MEEVWGEVDHTINYPHSTGSVGCAEQLKVLARVTSSATRLVDSIFVTLADHNEATGPQAAKPRPSGPAAKAYKKEIEVQTSPHTQMFYARKIEARRPVLFVLACVHGAAMHLAGVRMCGPGQGCPDRWLRERGRRCSLSSNARGREHHRQSRPHQGPAAGVAGVVAADGRTVGSVNGTTTIGRRCAKWERTMAISHRPCYPGGVVFHHAVSPGAADRCCLSITMHD